MCNAKMNLQTHHNFREIKTYIYNMAKSQVMVASETIEYVHRKHMLVNVEISHLQSHSLNIASLITIQTRCAFIATNTTKRRNSYQ